MKTSRVKRFVKIAKYANRLSGSKQAPPSTKLLAFSFGSGSTSVFVSGD